MKDDIKGGYWLPTGFSIKSMHCRSQPDKIVPLCKYQVIFKL